MKETHKGKSKFCLRVQCLCTTVQSGEEKKEIGKGHKDVDSVENFKCATQKCLAFKGDFGEKAAECVCMSPSKGEPRTARSASPPQRFVLDADFLF